MMEKFFAGFTFRTKTPSFESGDTIEVMVTGEDEEGHVARVGDTILRVEGAPDGAADTRILARVTEFDEKAHRGTAEYSETVGQSSF